MAQTLGEQLDEVQEAISRALKGQSVEIGDRRVEMPNLLRLQNLRKELLVEIAKYGRDYVPGASTKPLPRKARIVFG